MGLIVSSADGQEASFTFAHNLVRQTLLARISVPRRQLLHLRVAEALAHPQTVSQHAVATAHPMGHAGSLVQDSDWYAPWHWQEKAPGRPRRRRPSEGYTRKAPVCPLPNTI